MVLLKFRSFDPNVTLIYGQRVWIYRVQNYDIWSPPAPKIREGVVVNSSLNNTTAGYYICVYNNPFHDFQQRKQNVVVWHSISKLSDKSPKNIHYLRTEVSGPLSLGKVNNIRC